MIYDAADHLIFSQDGEQRKQVPQKWSFNIPDVFGRTVQTKVISNDSLIYTADPLKGIIVKADWAKTSNNYKGYNVSGITLSSPTILDVNYYDRSISIFTQHWARHPSRKCTSMSTIMQKD